MKITKNILFFNYIFLFKSKIYFFIIYLIHLFNMVEKSEIDISYKYLQKNSLNLEKEIPLKNLNQHSKGKSLKNEFEVNCFLLNIKL